MPKHGIVHAVNHGADHGIFRGGGGIPGVTLDAASGLYFPANDAEWATLRAATGFSADSPTHTWNLQDAAGNPAEADGGTVLTAVNTPNYQQAVTGFTRLGIGLDDNTSDGLHMPLGTGPDPATTSQAWAFVVRMPAAPAAARSLVGLRVNISTTACRIMWQAGGGLRLNVNGNNTDDATVHQSGTFVLMVKYDRAGSEAKAYTNLVKISGTYSAGVTDGNKGVGTSTSGAVQAVYGCHWESAPAEALTDARVKALLQAMGFTIPWT